MAHYNYIISMPRFRAYNKLTGYPPEIIIEDVIYPIALREKSILFLMTASFSLITLPVI